MLLARALIRLKFLHLLTTHNLRHLISLPLFEAEPSALVAIVFVVLLVLVVFNLDDVTVDGGWVEREGDEGVHVCGFGNESESP